MFCILLREGFCKGGVSPVIAVVLLILLVIALTSIIFSWANGFFNDQTRDSQSDYSAGKICDSLDIVVTFIGRDVDDYSFEAVNRGSSDVKGLKFKLFDSGNSEFVDSDIVDLFAGKALVGKFTYGDFFEKDKVEVYAVLDKDLVGATSDVTCESKKILVGGTSVI